MSWNSVGRDSEAHCVFGAVTGYAADAGREDGNWKAAAAVHGRQACLCPVDERDGR